MGSTCAIALGGDRGEAQGIASMDSTLDSGRFQTRVLEEKKVQMT